MNTNDLTSSQTGHVLEITTLLNNARVDEVTLTSSNQQIIALVHSRAVKDEEILNSGVINVEWLGSLYDIRKELERLLSMAEDLQAVSYKKYRKVFL